MGGKNGSSLPRDSAPATLAAQALGRIDEATRAIVPPIQIASTYERDPDNQYRSGHTYGRPDNATFSHAEAVLAALDGGEIEPLIRELRAAWRIDHADESDREFAQSVYRQLITEGLRPGSEENVRAILDASESA